MNVIIPDACQFCNRNVVLQGMQAPDGTVLCISCYDKMKEMFE